MTEKKLPIDTLTNAGSIFEYLQSLEMTPTQSLGQNFLSDRPLLEALAASTHVAEEDLIVEVGPGLGHLTRVLCEHGSKVLAIEKDQRLANTLAERLGEPENLTVIHEDILEVETNVIENWREGRKVLFVGNLPYYCSSQILIRLFEEWLPIWKRCGFLLQEEVVDRLVSKPGSKTYGRLSVLTQLYSKPKKTRKVPPHLFVPKPEVTSAWIVLESVEDPPELHPSEIAHLTGICFGERRKTLLNNLGREFGKERAHEMLAEAGIEEGRRAESLSPSDFLRLAHLP
ncbi:MAG: ribosomal RNA small subunit methyltransferase A [Candidatus Omnitrophica bacterium]|nr:ribosomal RNA small subunit methyltransferase A [Candidatus Omnitrophota bacterium]